MQITIRSREDELLIELPPEATAKLGWAAGDLLNIELAADGLKVTRAITDFDRTTEIARQGMEEYREALEVLAKS